ncbi:MAG TPA: deoxyribodipyrimidine photo-lyase [Thermoanaerobaculia bacterium]|nr:deoxyribodipyrimidine photo-lyase [Thermoanaerobaculia bacterium]
MTTIVHWFRRDLRVADNTSLSRAARDADRVVPAFVLDDHYLEGSNVGPARFRFLRDSLEELERTLVAAGGRLVVRRGPPARALPEILAETGASAVYANVEIGPYPERRDRDARAAVESAGGRLRLFGDALLVEPDAIATDAGGPYTVYSPFSRKWRAAGKLPPLPAPRSLATPDLSSVSLARVRAWRDLATDFRAPRGGASEAMRLLARFVEGPLARYERDRDIPARDGTSRLSPHLHFGTVSPRTVLASIGTKAPGARKFELELAWREFFHHLLFHFPGVAAEAFRPEFRGFPWRGGREAITAWQEGRTGYPFVDAGMRQLRETHWMHNRARMTVASFLTKDLHADWKTGEKWFEHELADADLANNNGGWQWAAGTGADAAPYFRILNPVLQSKRLDPRGEYIRRYVPELARVPDSKIHEPWTMSRAEQRAAGCIIGRDYSAPIVDHAREREVALALFEKVRKKP